MVNQGGDDYLYGQGDDNVDGTTETTAVCVWASVEADDSDEENEGDERNEWEEQAGMSDIEDALGWAPDPWRDKG